MEVPLAIVCLWLFKCVSIGFLSYKLKLARHAPLKLTQSTSTEFPTVCIQIPLYNEPDHCLNVIRCCLAQQWSAEKLEIQILDDSTDQTSEKIARFLLQSQHSAMVSHIRRPNRAGFKAGALNHGLQKTQAEYIAIFDADFTPGPTFLTDTVRHLQSDGRLACVQARWSFQNDDSSFLSRMQILFLNLHFRVEHFGRHNRNLLFNFNGTAGIWRKSAIENAGGWKDDSVCEDLLLSFRSQLAGYKIRYLDHVTCKSILPRTLDSFLTQQRRWAKGNGQGFRLLAKQILLAKRLNHYQKIDSLLHFCGYGVSTLVLLFFTTSPFWITLKSHWLATTSPMSPARILDLILWCGALASFFLVFCHGRVSPLYTGSRKIWDALLVLFSAPLLSIFLVGHFWRGLLALGKSDRQKYFAKTPKGRYEKSKLTGYGHICFVVSIATLSAYMAAVSSQFFTCFMCQGVAATSLYFGFVDRIAHKSFASESA